MTGNVVTVYTLHVVVLRRFGPLTPPQKDSRDPGQGRQVAVVSFEQPGDGDHWRTIPPSEGGFFLL